MRSLRFGLTIFAALILLGVDPTTAPAQEPAQQSSISEEVRAQGRRLQDEARTHVDAERWGLAAQSYRQVYELGREHGLAQAPLALWNVGLALMRIPGREAEARDAFRQFLDESTTLTEDPQVRDWRSTALEHIAEIDARVGQEQDEPEPAHPSEPEPSENREGPHDGEISPWGPIVLAVGIAGLGVGAVLGALALVNNSALNMRCGGTLCPDTAENRSTHDEMWSLAAGSDVALVIGGLAATTGLVLTLVLRESPADSNAAQARILVRPWGLMLEGSF